MYYRRDRLCSYDALGNIILGERGTGKSFCFKEWAINDENAITIWMRRTDIERKDPRNWKTFVNDLLAENAIDADSEYKVASEGVFKDGVQKVFHSALSTDSAKQSMVFLPDCTGNVSIDGISKKKKKNVSKDSEENDKLTKYLEENNLFIKKQSEEINCIVDDIIYDAPSDRKKTFKKRIVFEEFIQPNGQYLTKEVELFLNFYVTVDRYSDTKYFMIGNRISFYNPYFEYFNIYPFTEEFKWFKEKTILVHNYSCPEFNNKVKDTQFYKMIKGTDFANYLTSKEVWKDSNSFIQKRPDNSKPYHNFKFRDKIYGLWYDENGNVFVSKKYNPQSKTFTSPSERKEGELLTLKGETLHLVLVDKFNLGKLFFETINIKYSTLEFINGGYKK